jgi:hypothetical protein
VREPAFRRIVDPGMFWLSTFPGIPLADGRETRNVLNPLGVMTPVFLSRVQTRVQTRDRCDTGPLARRCNDAPITQPVKFDGPLLRDDISLSPADLLPATNDGRVRI